MILSIPNGNAMPNSGNNLMASTEELVVKISGDVTQLRTALRSIETNTQKTTSKMQAGMSASSRAANGLGKRLLYLVGIQQTLAAASRVARKELDFSATMAKITGLVGIQRAQVNAWKADVEKLAVTYGRSTAEMAEGLFFVTSAGFRGKAAIDALEASVKGAASGLGETATVADAATSAVNAYGQANLDAADAVGIIVATVREGKAEASSIAGALGRVINIAAETGVQFYEVGAAIAAMTRTGTTARGAVVNLSGVLQAIIRPTKDAEAAALGMGVNFKDIQNIIREQGLLVALQSLKEAADRNGESMVRLFPNMEALRAVLGLLGKTAKETEAIFADMATSGVKDLNKAYDSAAREGAHKLNVAQEQLSVSAGKLARVAMPAAIGAMERLSQVMTNAAEKSGVVGRAWDELIARAKLGASIQFGINFGPAADPGKGLKFEDIAESEDGGPVVRGKGTPAAKQKTGYTEDSQKVIDDLKHETSQLMLNSREQFINNAVKEAGVKGTSDAGKEIQKLAAALYDQSEAEAKVASQTDKVTEGFNAIRQETEALDDALYGLQQQMALEGESLQKLIGAQKVSNEEREVARKLIEAEAAIGPERFEREKAGIESVIRANQELNKTLTAQTAITAFKKDSAQETQNLKRLIAAQKVSNEEREVTQKLIEAEAAIGPKRFAAEKAGIESVIRANQALNKELENQKKAIDDAKDTAEEYASAFGSALEGAVLDGEDFVASITDSFQRIAFKKLITEPLEKAFTDLVTGKQGLGSILSSLFSSTPAAPAGAGGGAAGQQTSDALDKVKALMGGDECGCIQLKEINKGIGGLGEKGLKKSLGGSAGDFDGTGIQDALEWTADDIGQYNDILDDTLMDANADMGGIFGEFFGDAGTTLDGVVGDFGTLFSDFGGDFSSVLSGLLDNLSQIGGGGGGGGGGLGGIFGGLGDLFGGGGGNMVDAGVFDAAPNFMFAKGGVSNGPAIFGEAGPEAAVPLPDGRTIPVTLSGGTGEGATVNQTLNFSTGVSATVRAEVMNMLPMIQASTIQAVQDKTRRTPGFIGGK
jgi:TP901 family phage tail tape measure protein